MRGLGILKRLRKSKANDQHAPIQNLDSIDIVGRRHDGGVDCVIVASGPLTNDPDILLLLRSKVEAYLGHINSQKFRDEFNNPLPEKTAIVVVSTVSVDPAVVEFVERMEPWVEDNNARIRLEEKVR